MLLPLTFSSDIFLTVLSRFTYSAYRMLLKNVLTAEEHYFYSYMVNTEFKYNILPAVLCKPAEKQEIVSATNKIRLLTCSVRCLQSYYILLNAKKTLKKIVLFENCVFLFNPHFKRTKNIRRLPPQAVL